MMDNSAYCETLVRENDPDRYFATLFAPADRRPALFALYAFNSEIARIRDSVSDPMPGEIRLAWWREVLEGSRALEAASHPVASALMAAIRDNRLPLAPLVALVDARIFDLYDDPMPSVGDLEGYAGETSSALIRLAAIILAGGSEPGGAEAAGHAGVAYAITGLLRALPFHAQRGQMFIPAEILAAYGVQRNDVLSGRTTPELRAALAAMRALARQHLASARTLKESITALASPAFLPVALVDLYLKQMEKSGYDPFRTLVEVPQWRRQLRFFLAARKGRALG